MFNLQQIAAAAREFIGEWGGGDEVRAFIASSAEPGFGHWQPDAEAGTQRSPETTTTAAPDQVRYYMQCCLRALQDTCCRFWLA